MKKLNILARRGDTEKKNMNKLNILARGRDRKQKKIKKMNIKKLNILARGGDTGQTEEEAGKTAGKRQFHLFGCKSSKIDAI